MAGGLLPEGDAGSAATLSLVLSAGVPAETFSRGDGLVAGGDARALGVDAGVGLTRYLVTAKLTERFTVTSLGARQPWTCR